MTLEAPLFAVGHRPLKILRYPTGEYVDGDWVISEPEEIIVTANIQPAKYSENQQLPESKRSKDTIKVYSRCEIREAKVGRNGWSADRVIWNGKVFEVFKVQHFQMNRLNHYKAICYMIELTPDTQEEE